MFFVDQEQRAFRTQWRGHRAAISSAINQGRRFPFRGRWHMLVQHWENQPAASLSLDHRGDGLARLRPHLNRTTARGTEMSMSATSQQASGFRWVMLVLGIVCMTMIANLQYGWTLFVGPMDDKYHWGRAAIQVAFSIFVLTETWLVPIEGWFVDRFGPKIVVLVGGVLCGIAWAMNAYASSLGMLYAAAAIGG